MILAEGLRDKGGDGRLIPRRQDGAAQVAGGARLIHVPTQMLARDAQADVAPVKGQKRPVVAQDKIGKCCPLRRG